MICTSFSIRRGELAFFNLFQAANRPGPVFWAADIQLSLSRPFFACKYYTFFDTAHRQPVPEQHTVPFPVAAPPFTDAVHRTAYFLFQGTATDATFDKK